MSFGTPRPIEVKYDAEIVKNMLALLKASPFPDKPPIDCDTPWKLGIDYEYLKKCPGTYISSRQADLKPLQRPKSIHGRPWPHQECFIVMNSRLLHASWGRAGRTATAAQHHTAYTHTHTHNGGGDGAIPPAKIGRAHV